MSGKQGIDVLERIAGLNPVSDERLGEGQLARSEELLARLVAVPAGEGTPAVGDGVAAVGGAGVAAHASTEGGVDGAGSVSGLGPARTVQEVGAAHRAHEGAGTRRHSGVRLAARGVAIALAGVLGLGAAAYATGVTPKSVSVGLEALRSVDAGTVTYSDSPTMDGALVLARIARDSESSQDLGDPTQVVVTNSLGSGDAWYDEDPQPGMVTSNRWDWTLKNGIRRFKTVETSRDGVNPETPVMDFYLEQLPPDPNPQYDPERRAIGRDLQLGPTPEATVNTLLGDEPRDSGRADWMVVDAYNSYWTEGIGLTAANRAAFVRALATLDYVYYGSATDQLGRRGEAFGVDWRSSSGDEEYRILLDPDNGALLAVESVLHGPWILGSKDHVTWSNTWVSIETVDSVPACEDIEGCVVAKEG